MATLAIPCVCAGVLLIAFGGTSAVAIPSGCSARLQLKLDPDVSNPRDPSFLTALVSSPMYELVWVSGNDVTAVYDLSGPATDYRCEEEISRMQRNAGVLELTVLEEQ